MKKLLLLCLFFVSSLIFAQGKNGTKETIRNSNADLLNQFIKAKGSGIIVFDSNNIKQFWIDNSVFANKKDSFEILLNKKAANLSNESVPLKIQLMNVSEMDDCKIEVLSETNDFNFSVINSNLKTVSSSEKEDSFLNYTIASSVLHLEDVQNLSFSLKFDSNTHNALSINKIILSFTKNPETSFVASPGTISLNSDSFKIDGCNIVDDNLNSFSVTGKNSNVFSTKKILISDNPVSASVTIENIGDEAATLYVGYAPYTKEGKLIMRENTPYKNINKVLKVISSKSDSSIVTVDSYPEWAKGCSLASNAKEDLSDFPNFSVEGRIDKINEIDDGKAEIVLTKPIGKAIPKDSFVRIQSPGGATYIYVNTRKINPGEKVTLKSSIKIDDKYYQHSNQAFCHKTYYVAPVIRSFSVDPSKKNTILISECSVSF